MSEKPERDVEKVYAVKDFVAKLRRLADSLEQGKAFTIQVDGERFTVPANAHMSIEHERSADGEELEFQLKWNLAPEDEESEDEEEGSEDEGSEDEDAGETAAEGSAEKPAEE